MMDDGDLAARGVNFNFPQMKPSQHINKIIHLATTGMLCCSAAAAPS